MKHLVITLAALFAAASAMAQGQVNFATRVTGAVDAIVTYKTTGLPVDSTIQAQLWAAAPGGTLAPVGAPTVFRTGSGQGYITAGGIVDIPGTVSGGSADVRLVAWTAGKAYNQVGIGDWMGESATFTLSDLGGGTTPPRNLVGLQAFQVDQVIPEPSMAALGLLGAGLLLIRRKK